MVKATLVSLLGCVALPAFWYSFASSAELLFPGLSNSTLTQIGQANQLASPIDRRFRIDPEYGTDRINGLHGYVNSLKIAQELALKDDRFRVPEKDYSYPGATDVTIHIRGE